MFETSNDLPPATRRSAIQLLNEHLADAIDLQLQAKQAHWNIKGPNFTGLHDLFERVAIRRASMPTRLPRERSRSAEWPEARSRRCPANHSCANTLLRSATGASRPRHAGCACDVRPRRTPRNRPSNSVERRRHRRPVHGDIARGGQISVDG